MVKIKNIFSQFFMVCAFGFVASAVCMDHSDAKRLFVNACSGIAYVGPSLQKAQERSEVRVLSPDGKKIYSGFNEPLCILVIAEENQKRGVFVPLLTVLSTRVGEQIGSLNMVGMKKDIFYGEELNASICHQLYNFKITPNALDACNSHKELQDLKVINKDGTLINHGTRGHYFPDVDYNMPLGDQDRYGQ